MFTLSLSVMGLDRDLQWQQKVDVRIRDGLEEACKQLEKRIAVQEELIERSLECIAKLDKRRAKESDSVVCRYFLEQSKEWELFIAECQEKLGSIKEKLGKYEAEFQQVQREIVQRQDQIIGWWLLRL